MKKLFVLGMSSAFALGAAAQTLEERVEALEFAGYENIFKFSGQLEMRYDNITTKVDDEGSPLTTADDVDEEASLSYFRNFLRLNMSAQPSDKLSFFGRLSAAMYHNKQSSPANGDLVPGFTEGAIAGGDRNSDAYFERFFVNYKMSDKATFTFGRIPTGNGTPYHLERNESQGGTYPLFAYNNIFDGMAFTYNVNPTWNFKFVYTPSTFLNEGTATAKAYKKATNDAGGEIESTHNIYALIAEYNKSNTSWARNTNFIFNYLNVEEELAIGVTDGVSGSQTDLGLGLERFVLALEMTGVKGSKFDFGLQLVSETTKSNGLYQPQAGVSLGYQTDEDGDENSATSTLLTLRYATSETSKVGLQFTQGSEYSFGGGGVSRHAIDFYGIKGNAYHLFYNKAFEGGLNMNIGYITVNQEYDNTASGIFGKPHEVDNTTQNVYTSFVANF